MYDDVLTVREIAKRWDYNVQSIYNLIKKEKLPAHKTKFGLIVERREVIRYEKENNVQVDRMDI